MTVHGPQGEPVPPQSVSPTPGGPQHKRQGRAKRWIVAGVLLAIVAGVAGTIYYRLHAPTANVSAPGEGKRRGGAGAPGANGAATPVTAMAVTTGDLPVYLSGLGTVTPAASVVVHSRVDGQLMKVHFFEGQMIKAGALLAELDPRPFQVQVTQMEGQLARDQALLANARLDLARYQTLLQQDSIAKQTVDTQMSLVRQYEGIVKSDEGQLGNARLQLAYASVTAPVSGRVGLRQVDPGNIVHASDTNGIVIINQVQPISVLYTLPEDNLQTVIDRVASGQSLPVDAFDRAGKVKLASGKLLTLDNQIDTTTGTVKLKAEFSNENGRLFPNQFVNVKMLIDTQKGATLIPAAAVQRGTQGNFVYSVQADNTVKQKTVSLGATDGNRIAVASGVVAGESLVVDGLDKLRDGAKVEVITAASRKAATAPRQPGEPRHGQRRQSAQ